MKKIITFIIAIAISFIPGIIGIMFTPINGGDAWFNALGKSALNPDAWVFGVAWTLLYTILGCALYLIIRDPSHMRDKIGSYLYFGMHIILNAAWSYVFFGCHMPMPALMIVAVLILISIWMMMSFMSLRRVAGWLVLPYVIWLIFAAYLNGTTVFMQYNLNGMVDAITYIMSYIK
ncbi:MAG: tryptophan-rich sensory protein [Alphaproteobacteria bacterium]|nr:tryptophan-rich sensory protein [Alphaproteobacteria bacterium]